MYVYNNKGQGSLDQEVITSVEQTTKQISESEITLVMLKAIKSWQIS